VAWVDPARLSLAAIAAWGGAWLAYSLAILSRGRGLGRIASFLSLAGVGACGAWLAARWLAAGPVHAPWSGGAESLAWAAAGVAVAQLALDLRHGARFSGAIALALAAAGMLAARWLGGVVDGGAVAGAAGWRARLGLDFAEAMTAARAALAFCAWCFFAGGALRAFQYVARAEARTERVLFGVSFAAALVLPLAAGDRFLAEAELYFGNARVPMGGRLLEVAVGAFATQWAGTIALPHLRGTWAGWLARGLRWCFAVGVVAIAALGAAALRARSTVPGFSLAREPWLMAGAVAIGGTGAFLALWMLDREKRSGAIPPAAALDAGTYRALASGFAFLVLSAALGAVASALALGELWSGSAREAACLGVGSVYAGILHLRMEGVGGAKGTAWAALAAFMIAACAVTAGRLLVPGIGG
jgi:ABC-type transport system involved in cytochrome c biogenesis permease subunit